MPYIVVVVDEYGDLIMTAGKEIELPIARIAQKARAVGIHMIIATQRPSARIITGIIKANFPARMAFRVGQSIDSSIILDKPGAQQLIGRGDLLFSSGNNLTRVQCAFVDTPEVDRINRYIAEQQSYPTAFILPEPPSDGNGDGESGGPVDLNHLDPLFNEAAEMVVASGQGSTSIQPCRAFDGSVGSRGYRRTLRGQQGAFRACRRRYRTATGFGQPSQRLSDPNRRSYC
jgi:S-DNA-T family DNA segregation ATPase FtsK/SpoIIIE